MVLLHHRIVSYALCISCELCALPSHAQLAIDLQCCHTQTAFTDCCVVSSSSNSEGTAAAG